MKLPEQVVKDLLFIRCTEDVKFKDENSTHNNGIFMKQKFVGLKDMEAEVLFKQKGYSINELESHVKWMIEGRIADALPKRNTSDLLDALQRIKDFHNECIKDHNLTRR